MAKRIFLLLAVALAAMLMPESLSHAADYAIPSTESSQASLVPQGREEKNIAPPNSPIVLSCPQELKHRVVVSGLETDGWIVGGGEQVAPLKGARMFNGPPNEVTIARYNEITAIPFIDRESSEFRQVWSFEPSMFAAGITLLCDYSGANQFLMHAIPEKTQECREITALDQQDKNTTRVLCR